jgi:hypothetical protein
MALKKCSTYLFSFLNALYETSVCKKQMYLLTSFSTAEGSFHKAKIQLGRYQPINELSIAFDKEALRELL